MAPTLTFEEEKDKETAEKFVDGNLVVKHKEVVLNLIDDLEKGLLKMLIENEMDHRAWTALIMGDYYKDNVIQGQASAAKKNADIIQRKLTELKQLREEVEKDKLYA